MTLRIVQSVVTTLSLLVRLRRDFSSPSAKQSAMCSRNSLVARLKKSRTHLLHFWKSLPLTYTAIIPPRPNTATSNVLRNTKSKQHPCTLPAWRTSILLHSWASPRRLRASQTMQCQRISFFFPSVSLSKLGISPLWVVVRCSEQASWWPLSLYAEIVRAMRVLWIPMCQYAKVEAVVDETLARWEMMPCLVAAHNDPVGGSPRRCEALSNVFKQAQLDANATVVIKLEQEHRELKQARYVYHRRVGRPEDGKNPNFSRLHLEPHPSRWWKVLLKIDFKTVNTVLSQAFNNKMLQIYCNTKSVDCGLPF